MATLLEYVGNVHIYLGPYRGNPIALYLKRNGDRCVISPKVYPWNEVLGVGETPNKAAADFEDKWKAKGLSPEMYTGPSWEGGIKPERPKPAPPQKPAGAAAPAGAVPPTGRVPAPTTTPAPAQEPAGVMPAATTQPSAATPPSPLSPERQPDDSEGSGQATASTNSSDEKSHNPQQN